VLARNLLPWCALYIATHSAGYPSLAVGEYDRSSLPINNFVVDIVVSIVDIDESVSTVSNRL
jgi:hypothetical protein